MNIRGLIVSQIIFSPLAHWCENVTYLCKFVYFLLFQRWRVQIGQQIDCREVSTKLFPSNHEATLFVDN